MTDDATLLRNYAQGRSEEAFAELVRRHLPLVYSAALRRTDGDAHRARDVAQIVFTELAREAARLARHAALVAWLYTVTRHAAIDLMRTERRRRQREERAGLTDAIVRSVETPVDWERLRPVLDEAMDEMDERDREAVLLRFFANQPFAAIASALRTSEDAARKRVDRALDKLGVLLSRRGITSTGAALALLLAREVSVAVPAGMAASVATVAMAGAGAGVAMAGATAIFGLVASKLVLGTAAVVALAAAGTAAYRATTDRAQASSAAAVAPVAAEVAAASSVSPALEQKAAARVTMPPLGSAEIRAADFVALGERLRAEGFPPDVVRNVVADVIGHHYEQIGYATIRPKRDPAEYWRSVVIRPTPAENTARRKLEDEQSAMGEAVFGRDYRVSDDLARRRYHGISEANVEKMKKIFADYAQLEDELRAQGNAPALQARWEMLSRELRADLERTLTPEEYRLYELRNGSATQRLKSYLGAFEVTEAEFLALHPTAQELEAQAAQFRGREGRQAEMARLEAAARRVLGEERYAAFVKARRE